jgi:hypothetical protein
MKPFFLLLASLCLVQAGCMPDRKNYLEYSYGGEEGPAFEFVLEGDSVFIKAYDRWSGPVTLSPYTLSKAQRDSVWERLTFMANNGLIEMVPVSAQHHTQRLDLLIDGKLHRYSGNGLHLSSDQATRWVLAFTDRQIRTHIGRKKIEFLVSSPVNTAFAHTDTFDLIDPYGNSYVSPASKRDSSRKALVLGYDSVIIDHSSAGRKKVETAYNEGKISAIRVFIDGKRVMEVSYKNGLLDGDWYIYDPTSKKAAVHCYSGGKHISSRAITE